ncbi:MAG TPA: CDP-glycerol glycerophosphotransferase family protein [Burkholderiaceae bacterium]|nr:CDP-glycerol glycerophosphotransferase family protein [Burkholderiaceae bacterium]
MTNPLNTGAAIDEALKPRVAALEEWQMSTHFAALSGRVKKRPMVLFFGRDTFADNSKYLYLQALAAPRGYEVLWCAFDKDLVAQLQAAGLPVHTLCHDINATLDLLLHAAVAVFCVNPNESLRGSVALNACLDGAAKLQLWHGVSVKHLLLMLIPHLGMREAGLRLPFELASRADHVLSTAACFDAYWRRAFGCRTLVRAGFPRNEMMLREPRYEEMIGAEIPDAMAQRLASGGKNVLVVPTWQRGRPTWLTEEDCLRRLAALGRKEHINFFVKMHPAYFLQMGANTREAAGLHLLHPGVDVYPWLRFFDALVTDYSSIMFDFLHTGAPVLSLDLQRGDHQDFEPDWSLVPDVEFRHRFTPGDFERQLQRALHDDALQDRRAEMRGRIFESDPLAAGASLLHLVDRLVDRSQQDDFTVDFCGAAPVSRAAPMETLIRRIEADSLTHAG